jgi:cell wall-associated NlpC family hydrolase
MKRLFVMLAEKLKRHPKSLETDNTASKDSESEKTPMYKKNILRIPAIAAAALAAVLLSVLGVPQAEEGPLALAAGQAEEKRIAVASDGGEAETEEQKLTVDAEILEEEISRLGKTEHVAELNEVTVPGAGGEQENLDMAGEVFESATGGQVVEQGKPADGDGAAGQGGNAGADGEDAAAAALKGEDSDMEETARQTGEEKSDGQTAEGEGEDVQADDVGKADEGTDGAVNPASAQSAMDPEDLPESVEARVVILKKRLMALGYMQQDILTGSYDPYTQLGVMFFQRDNSLTVTGIADAMTLIAVIDENAKPYLMQDGTEGEDVRQLQSGLLSLGYPLEVTSKYDAMTAEAVKLFQSQRGAEPTGIVDAYLRQIIANEAALNGTFMTDTNPRVEAMISVGQQQLGKPYSLGAKGPDAFDCSGFVYYCLNQSGYAIEYMTSGGWASSDYETVTGVENLQRGDIVCFSGHVGIYLGDGVMMDASNSANAIRITNDIRNTAYWTNSFICGKRVF